MHEFDLDLKALKATFKEVRREPYLLIELAQADIDAVADELSIAIRRCYVSDAKLDERAEEAAVKKSELVTAKVPDRGSVMSGDFGEIITSFFQAAEVHPDELLDPKKWRLKQSRTAPAPHSDVVQFLLPEWPESSTQDCLLCAEVKTKSTGGSSTPIVSAIEGAMLDRKTRLVKTLVWLRERALDTDLGTVTIRHLNRFIEATDHPPATRSFRAVAVICSSLVENETQNVNAPPSSECSLVVIAVPDLKHNYETLYDAVIEGVSDEPIP